MLPEILNADYNNLLRTSEPFSCFHKLIHFNLSLLKYLSALMFSIVTKSQFRNPKIEKIICECFFRPTEGIWLNLTEALLTAKYNSDIKNNLSSLRLSTKDTEQISNLLTYVLNIPTQNKKTLTILQYFQKIIKIKNKCISHGTIDEETAKKINDILNPIMNNTLSMLKIELEYPLLLVSENTDDGNYYINDAFSFNSSKANLSDVCFEGLYFNINDELFNAWPLLACRDGNIYLYNKFDKDTQKIFYSGSKGKDTYIRTDKENVSQLFSIDYSALNLKPLDVTVAISKEGVSHNLPSRDYNDFIGREYELSELVKLLNHKRHFISALDGIGGVGKSALALELCYRTINKELQNEFEYVIWLSSKNTIFKDGKVQEITQTFEHLDQLVDTILIVLGFGEYVNLESNRKKSIILDILNGTATLLVLDNLETITTSNLNDIWSFLDEIPTPSKIILTSREYHHNVTQTIRIDSFNESDSLAFIELHGSELSITKEYINTVKHDVYLLSSGLPIVIKSILGQLSLGKNIRTIKKEIESNKDNLAKFCFEKQLELLDKDQNIVLLSLCLSTDTIDHDGLTFILSDILSTSIIEIINKLNMLSLIKIAYSDDFSEYSILPVIKMYVLAKNKDSEQINEIEKRFSEYYQLREVDSYHLQPIEDCVIEKGSLIPRKIVDKAMQHAIAGEFEQSEVFFKKAVKNYPNESYVWYIYSNYNAHYLSKYDDAIGCLKKANEISKNYIYSKNIGDYQLKLKYYQAAITSYKNAYEAAELDKNKQEMVYSIANAEYAMVKKLRRIAKESRNQEIRDQRNNCYRSIVEHLENYISRGCKKDCVNSHIRY